MFCVASFLKIEKGKAAKCFRRDLFSLFVMTGGLWAIVISFYDVKIYRDYRLLAPALLFAFLYVFCSEENGRLKIASVIFIVIMGAFSLKEGITEGRDIAVRVEEDASFSALADDAGGEVKTIGATTDVNWGDVSLMKSVPSEFGYKVFEEKETEDLSLVDYVLTTRQYLDEHDYLKPQLEFMFETKDSYLVYKVR